MSNLDPTPEEIQAGPATVQAADQQAGQPADRPAETPVRELLAGHEVALGGTRAMAVTRTLPNRGRRTVGAWCFADSYGPTDLGSHPGMLVPPHPHTALQTVSWLLAGEVLHRDSLGNRQLIRPGQLNLMTAGRGIAHSEQTPAEHSPVLHGVQLWVALPTAAMQVEPQFEHHAELPVYADGGVAVTVLLGDFGGVVSPARTYTPLVGVDAVLEPGASAQLPLRPEFEYAALSLAGRVRVDGVELGPGPLLYLGSGRSELAVEVETSADTEAGTDDSAGPARLLLIGGEPFEEQLVMWWNFVGRSHEEIVQARQDWQDGDPERFGVVVGYDGEPLPAPALPTTRLKPRGRLR